MFGKKGKILDFNIISGKWKKSIDNIKKEDKTIGLYIHIPYCKNICFFCDCFSKFGSQKKVEQYAGLLLKEIKRFALIFKGVNFNTLYFGGGTPSVFSENILNKLLKNVFESFNLKEVHSSFEGCPKTLTDEKIKILKKYNFKRITIGVQSFDKKVLKLNNRSYASVKLVEHLVKRCKKYGILVNLELICGLKGQSQKSFLNDVNRVAKIRPNQIHLYYFEYNPATLIWHKNQFNNINKNERMLWKKKGVELLNKLDYKFFPYSGPADRFEAINMQIYNSRIHNSYLLGLGDGALSSVNGNFRYGSILNNNEFAYKKLSKRFVEYAEVFNL